MGPELCRYRAVVFRYERLHDDPLHELQCSTNLIAPVTRERIEHALKDCSVENMKRKGARMTRRIRIATVGDWRNHLTELHLAIFRERYADLICHLGYEIH